MDYIVYWTIFCEFNILVPFFEGFFLINLLRNIYMYHFEISGEDLFKSANAIVTLHLNESFTVNILMCLTYFMHVTKKWKINICQHAS